MNDIHFYSKCADCAIEQLIRLRAYEIWEYRGDNNLEFRFDEKKNDLVKITAEDDWCEAEQEILKGLAYDKRLY